MSPRYEKPTELSRSVACDQLNGGDATGRVEALLSLALYDVEGWWVQDRCLEHLHDSDPDVVSTAILALGHVARLHHSLDLDRVLSELQRLRRDPALSGRIDDALDDIQIFVTPSDPQNESDRP